jgi:hypothetical protein
MLESNHETELQRPVVELWPQIIHWLGPGINITVGHQPLAEQNADMAVHWLLCTDIMADRFVSFIWIFLPAFIVATVFYKICNLKHMQTKIPSARQTIAESDFAPIRTVC